MASVCVESTTLFRGLHCSGSGAPLTSKNVQLDIAIVVYLLEHLAIHLNKGGADWFGLLHHAADRPLEGVAIYRALDFDEQTEMPLRRRS